MCTNWKCIIFSDCYEVLSTCLSGNAPKHMNPESSRYLAEKLQKLAMTTKMKRNIKENKFVSGLPQRKEGRSYRSKKQARQIISIITKYIFILIVIHFRSK